MLLMLLKRLLFLSNKKIDSKRAFVKSGNLKYPTNSLIHQSYVEIFHGEENRNNIVIGNDCNIMGSISIYSSNAKLTIGERVFIGPQTKIICYEHIHIDDDVMISWDCTIMDTNSHSLISHERLNDVLSWNKGFEYKNWDNIQSKSIYIKKKCWIGFKSIILKGVVLGEGVVVASGSVVTKSFDDYSIIGGNPAKFIRKTT